MAKRAEGNNRVISNGLDKPTRSRPQQDYSGYNFKACTGYDIEPNDYTEWLDPCENHIVDHDTDPVCCLACKLGISTCSIDSNDDFVEYLANR